MTIKEQIITAYNGDEYEASILEAMAKTFNFEIRQGKSQIYVVCQNCHKRLNKNHYGQGALTDRIANHRCRK